MLCAVEQKSWKKLLLCTNTRKIGRVFWKKFAHVPVGYFLCWHLLTLAKGNDT
jgi:hypothetical protein